MKHMARGILLLFLFSTLPLVYAEAPKGVAGVSVMVKQNPSKHAVTDARGVFSLDGLPAGSYTLAFRPQKAKDIKTASTTKAIVATSYSIKVEGTKRPVTQSGLTSDKLLAGVEIRVDVGAGAKVRGQVLAETLKKMVWIPGEIGSNIPGHWADANSAEAKAKRSDTQTFSREEMIDSMTKGNANMTDPSDPRNALPGAGR